MKDTILQNYENNKNKMEQGIRRMFVKTNDPVDNFDEFLIDVEKNHDIIELNNNLISSKSNAERAILLTEYLTVNGFSLEELLCDNQFIAFLSISYFNEYVKSRVTNDNGTISKYQLGEKVLLLKGKKFRSYIYLLIDAVVRTYDETLDDPYHYTRYYFEKGSLNAYLTQINICANKKFFRTFMEVMEQNNFSSEEIKLYGIELNGLLAYKNLDVFDAKALHDVLNINSKDNNIKS